jgi:calcineurin-like phosphoesterase family protein
VGNIFVISDTHFGHEAILHFVDRDGRRIRPGFDTVGEMDDYIISRWNALVRPQDKVYHLGDVAMKKPYVQLVRMLNGHKRLVRGNHDIFDTKLYRDVGFEDIWGTRVLEVAKKESIILSHIPIHPGSLGRFVGNVHGHLHVESVADPRYLNVGVELMHYTPIEITEALRLLKVQQAEVNRPACSLTGTCV